MSADIKNFFEENGYEVYHWASAKPGGEIEEIRKFVNPDKKTPVMVFQKFSLNPASTVLGYRVAIGVFDRDKEVIVHDYNLGNNFKISYPDFEKMFTSQARAILAVWPSEKMSGTIKGPNDKISYPERLEAMDKLGELLIVKDLESWRYFKFAQFDKAISLYQEFLDDVNFKQYLPAVYQVALVSFLARKSLELNQPDEAIKIITERVIPINHDLVKVPPGWAAPLQDKFISPYFTLIKAYLKEGKKESAVSAYEEMKKVYEEIKKMAISQEKKKRYESTMGQLEKEIFRPLPQK